jgi:hypothetical protein
MNTINRQSDLDDYLAAIRRNFLDVELMTGDITLNGFEPWDKRFKRERFDVIRYSRANPNRAFGDRSNDTSVMYTIVNLPRNMTAGPNRPSEFERKFAGAFYLVDAMDGTALVAYHVVAYRNLQPGAISPYGGHKVEHTELDPSVVLHPVKSEHGAPNPYLGGWAPRVTYHVTLGHIRKPGERVVKRVGTAK